MTDVNESEHCLEKPDTEKLILQSQKGNVEAFRSLVEAYQGYGYALAFRLLANAEESRDIVQESMIRVWKHIQKLDAGSTFTTWYYRIVVNLCYDQLKRHARFRKKIAGMAGSQTPDHSNPEEHYLSRELSDLVLSAAAGLPPKQKTVFVLRDLQDLSIAEACSVTGMTPGAIRSTLFHARKRIRQSLAEALASG